MEWSYLVISASWLADTEGLPLLLAHVTNPFRTTSASRQLPLSMKAKFVRFSFRVSVAVLQLTRTNDNKDWDWHTNVIFILTQDRWTSFENSIANNCTRIVATRQTSKLDELFVSRASRNPTNHHLSRVFNGDRGVRSALNVDGGDQPSIADGSPRHVWETLGRANIDRGENG